MNFELLKCGYNYERAVERKCAAPGGMPIIEIYTPASGRADQHRYPRSGCANTWCIGTSAVDVRTLAWRIGTGSGRAWRIGTPAVDVRTPAVDVRTLAWRIDTPAVDVRTFVWRVDTIAVDFADLCMVHGDSRSGRADLRADHRTDPRSDVRQYVRPSGPPYTSAFLAVGGMRCTWICRCVSRTLLYMAECGTARGIQR